jgi:hypothetical protein
MFQIQEVKGWKPQLEKQEGPTPTRVFWEKRLQSIDNKGAEVFRASKEAAGYRKYRC